MCQWVVVCLCVCGGDMTIIIVSLKWTVFAIPSPCRSFLFLSVQHPGPFRGSQQYWSGPSSQKHGADATTLECVLYPRELTDQEGPHFLLYMVTEAKVPQGWKWVTIYRFLLLKRRKKVCVLQLEGPGLCRAAYKIASLTVSLSVLEFRCTEFLPGGVYTWYAPKYECACLRLRPPRPTEWNHMPRWGDWSRFLGRGWIVMLWCFTNIAMTTWNSEVILWMRIRGTEEIIWFSGT